MKYLNHNFEFDLSILSQFKKLASIKKHCMLEFLTQDFKQIFKKIAFRFQS